MHFSLMRRIFLPVAAKRFPCSGRQGICRQRIGIASRSGVGLRRNGARSAPPPPAHNGTAYWIKVTARTDGTFTVTNTRNGFAKTYAPNTGTN